MRIRTFNVVVLTLMAPLLGGCLGDAAYDYMPGAKVRYEDTAAGKVKVRDPIRFTNFMGQEVTIGNYIPKETVTFPEKHSPGTVVIKTSQRRLYYVLGDGKAIRYGIAVGEEGREFTGTSSVTQKKEWPDWRPPAEMRKRKPELPEYMPGGKDNPLGSRAMYLGNTLYRIHGTNAPWTIGGAESSGCIRMINEDVEDLYKRVKIGTTVVVQR
jgi:lipoprotein-anchoring transpeptidase ErfK/SrfK